RVTRSLRAAQGLMAHERRRYYRHPIETSVHITLDPGNQEQVGTTVDLSEGGLAVRLESNATTGMALRFRFMLPQTTITIEGKGEVAWIAGGLKGVKFGLIPSKARTEIQVWLTDKMIGVGVRPPAPVSAAARR